MGKLGCPCGNVISSVSYPNECIGTVVTQTEYDMKSGKTDFDLVDNGRDVWECRECGRLAVSYPGRTDNTVKWYSPDDGKPGHLMRYDDGSEGRRPAEPR